MWLFEKRGFVSVVAYDPKKDYNKSSKFRDIAKQGGTHLLIRARIKADLDWLKETVPSLHVETDAGADYAYRAVISRKQYKKALAASVDAIDYDSHFKEVSRDNSPKVAGRYQAMMSVWSAFANLQDVKPWSGNSWYGGGKSTGSYHYGGGKSTPTTPTYVAPAPPASRVGKPAKDIDDFLTEYINSGGETTYRGGNGPRTGFKPKDRVIGYSGAGEVVTVTPKNNGFDGVEVKLDSGRTVTFVSNFLMPEDLPKVTVIEDADEEDAEERDFEWMYDTGRKILDEGKALLDFPADQIETLDEDAFELLTRGQEAESYDEALTKDRFNDIYDEILWEKSTDKERVVIWSDMETVPAKYMQDAIRLFSDLEVSAGE